MSLLFVRCDDHLSEEVDDEGGGEQHEQNVEDQVGDVVVLSGEKIYVGGIG